ncbi:MAG: MBL fold metallo-hydrolase [Candidatus Dactylopiibacterium sp.]|nr:MBL fold metallo-hydrolase [Candidatus Dactylopiibacterium sp.]
MHHAALDFPFAAPPAPATPQAVAPGVFWLRLALPWALDHINLWLIEDDAGYALVDTGLGDAPTRALWTELLARLDRPLTRLIATHYHPDHLGNAAWLSARCGAPLHMAFGEYLLAHALHAQTGGHDLAAMLAHFRRHGLDEDSLAALAARGNIYRRGVPELPTHFHRLADGDQLRTGAHTWRAIVGHGHSPEHIALHSDSAGVLISGDMLLPRITPNIAVTAAMPDEDALGRFLGSLRRFEPLPADTLVLPAHGLPFRGLHARTDQLHAHHAERDATMIAALQTEQSAAGLLPVLFPRALDRHQLMFALGEAIAHLNHLWHRGLVERRENDGGLRFRRC